MCVASDTYAERVMPGVEFARKGSFPEFKMADGREGTLDFQPFEGVRFSDPKERGRTKRLEIETKAKVDEVRMPFFRLFSILISALMSIRVKFVL